MLECDRCKAKAVMSVKYGGHNFCRKHFNYFVEKRFLKTVRENKLFKLNERVLLAVSGGKDSIVLARLMKMLSEKLPLSMEALLIDEGIRGYRKKSLKAAERELKKQGIPFEVREMRYDRMVTVDGMAKRLKKEKRLERVCMHCGVLRRDIMNRHALEKGFDVIVTGHNLDDETENIVMNFFDNDLQRMARIGANTGVITHERFVRKVKPLILLNGREIAAYGLLNQLEMCLSECPHAGRSKRFYYRKHLNELEERYPGTKHSIYRTFSEISPLIKPGYRKGRLLECSGCGMPSSNKECMACSIQEEFKDKGPVV